MESEKNATVLPEKEKHQIRVFFDMKILKKVYNYSLVWQNQSNRAIKYVERPYTNRNYNQVAEMSSILSSREVKPGDYKR